MGDGALTFPPGDMGELQRWLVIGPCGAGKSTLAMELGERLALPVVHLDRLNWLPGWREEDREVFAQRVHEAVAQERWIIDGNYGGTLAMRLVRAQVVVWLDYSLARCLWGIGRRVMQWRGRVRPDMGEGCPEKLDFEFLVWAVTHHHASRRSVHQKLARHGRHVRLMRFTSPGQTRAFLQALHPALPSVFPAPTQTCR